MLPREPVSHLISAVQHALTAYSPTAADTDMNQLSALAKAVLTSVDVRHLRTVSDPPKFVAQLERLLKFVRRRERGKILTHVRHDPDRQGLIIETCMTDQPFLVSTMRALLSREGLEVRRLLNAIVPIRRNPAGIIRAVGTGAPESVMIVDIGPIDAVPDGLDARIEHSLRRAQAMVRDFQDMTDRIQELADSFFAVAADHKGEEATELHEAEGLLRWLADENSVLLSVDTHAIDGSVRERLGTSVVDEPERDQAAIAGVGSGTGKLVHFQRSAEESPVHRAGKPGHFIVPKFDAEGNRVGVCVIDGLFTYKALHTPPEEIPFVRATLLEMLVERDLKRDSDRGKNLTNAFNALPLEYLLSEDREVVWEVTERILQAEAEGGADVLIRVSEGGRFAFVVLSLPKSQYSEELRLNVQELILRALGATYADYGVYIDRYENAVIHYYATGDTPLHQADTAELQAAVLALAKGWSQRLQEALADLVDADRVAELFDVYEDAFNEQHKRRVSVERLKGDIACLECLRGGAEVDFDLFVSETGEHPGSLNLRVFSRHAINLSYELPLITHFGFEVVDEYSRPVELPGHPEMRMDNFRLDVRLDRRSAVMARRADVVEALRGVFSGTFGDDDLNRLVSGSQLTGHDVEVLRAYVAYMHQLRVAYNDELIRSTLVEYPSVAQAIVGWLSARFDPSIVSESAVKWTEEALTEELRLVADFTADRVLQAVAEVVRATRRTNAYVVDLSAGDALAFKIAAQELGFGSEPKPFREIWVHHREFEGVHLRGGRVARGGLRFSDRSEDFRTEIHGLMATQMVKNVLIVPMGAKGGFVLRDPPGDRQQLRAAGDQVYRKFIVALLSLTDNVVGGEVVTPKGILHDEGDDPYLVVAADKGTAHLSDTANEISMHRGFWLDDAFASGGSNGYDHKATGITARGAWEVSMRSFRELGIDPHSDVITAIGVGDMSGDVFGNGLLRSRTIKLLAAFNHRHIFIDPDPDPERSFVERERLFHAPASQWSDYDDGALSDGGGVFPRASKHVDLSARARALLGIADDRAVNGEDVIREILRMRVDLLWMGGIGTYIKASSESHADVGDKANDFARVDANEVRARVLAEGANLSITRRGRVEYARGGGHDYNAFLDNSGGVDVSDHEVNIKIMFAPLLAAGTVSREQRNALLQQCEAEIIDMVLDNNRAQSRMVSFDVHRSRRDVFRYGRTLEFLARKVPFRPKMFSMPDDEELASRARRKQGLFKTEAAVVCAHAKMLAYRELLDDEPLDDGLATRLTREYFPARISEPYADAVDGHLLHREIATTMLVNRIVDNAGGTFFAEVCGATGCSVRAVAHAYMNANDLGDADGLRARLYALEDKHRQLGVYRGMEIIQRSLEFATYHLLEESEPLRVDGEVVANTRELLSTIAELLPPSAREVTAARTAELVKAGVPEDLAGAIARLRYLTWALDAMRVANVLEREPRRMLDLQLRIAEGLDLRRLYEAITNMAYASRWDGPAAKALGRQLEFHLRTMVQLVTDDDVEAMFRRYRLHDLRGEVERQLEGNPSISAIVMLNDQLRRLLPVSHY